MAGGIKGITVKIGGDTTELGRALTDATSKSTALQKELKGVNTLLKFNPDNVTLLKQKADLLTKSISETKSKLDALVATQKKVDSGEIEMTEAEYRNLQREIAATEGKLDSLNKEAKEFGSVGAQQIANFGNKMKDAGSTVENVGRKVSALSATTGAVLGASVLSAAKYEDALAKLETIADTSEVSMEDLTKQIRKLSNQTGISSEDIANATYDAISAGQDTAHAVKFVSNATSLAKAGFTSTGASIDLLTTILNAYGLKTKEVKKVSDILINTQNRGKTTVDQLASSMGKVIPTANSMNVDLRQLAAAYAIMTSKGIATAETTTYVNSMLNELGKGGTGVALALKAKTGKSFKELMADGKSLGDVLQILSDYAEENEKGFNDLWGSAEAGKAALTLLSDGAKSFNDMAKDMDKSTGATGEALDKLDTPTTKAKKAINQLKNAGIELGQQALVSLAPLIDKITEAVKQLTQSFSNLSPEAKQIILIVGTLVTALGPALVVIGKLMQAVGSIMTMAPSIVSGVKGIGAAIAGLSGPVAAIIAVVVALTAAFVTLWTTNDEFRENITKIWTELVEKFKRFGADITAKINSLGFDFDNFGEVVKTAWMNLCDLLAPALEGTFKVISTIIGTALDYISGFIGVIVSLLKGDWAGAWEGAKQMVMSVLTGMVNIFKTGIEALKKATDVFLSWFGTSWTELWTSVKDLFSTVWNAIKTKVTNVIDAIKTTVSTVFTTIKDTIGDILDKIKTAISNGWSAIKDKTTDAWDSIKSAVTGAFKDAKDTIADIVDSIKEKVSNAWEKIKNITSDVFGGIKDTIKDAIEGAKDAFGDAVDKIKDIAKNIFDGITPKLELNLPKIKVDGGEAPWGIGGKGELPSFDVSWNALGAIFKKPTIFNTPAGLQGVGEAGAEAVAPLSELMKYVSAAVDNSGVVNRMDRLEAAMVAGFAGINTNQQIVLDTGVLVGETIDQIDAGLATTQMIRARGVV